MSLAQVRSALETALNGITPAIDVAWENAPYLPVAGTPYAAAYLLRAQPNNIEIGPGYTEQGVFQVSLYYPQNAGSAAVEARAELIRTAFAWRSSLVNNGIIVNITGTPEVGPSRPDGDRFMVPVKIRWSAQISS